METLKYAIIPMFWAVSVIAVGVLLLSWLIKKARGKDTKKTKRKLAVAAGCVLVLFIVIATYTPHGEKEETPSEPVVEAESKEPEQPKALPFLDDFTEYGYSAEQIEEIRAILTNVGIAEIADMEIQDNSIADIQTVQGIAFKDTSFGGGGKEVQVQFNIEKGELYLVAIYCPSYMTENQVPYLSGLEDRRSDLYYDIEGGYLKKIDWENKAVVDYSEAE